MKRTHKQAHIVCGLGFGDECKGSITDYLAREYKAHTVVRYNGASQAAHRVVLSNGKSHIFSQFGSATFIPGVRTHLSHFMLINPIGMMMEADVLKKLGVSDACARTTVDENSLIITPYHVAVNRLRESARGADRHGSCGQGVGETVRDAQVYPELALRVGDLRDKARFTDKLGRIQVLKAAHADELSIGLPECPLKTRELELVRDTRLERWVTWYEDFARSICIVPSTHLESVMDRAGAVIFEGAQGVLLDETYGFRPHVTSTTTTTTNARTLLAEVNYSGQVCAYGLLRAYMTRHGHGPFVTEDAALGQRIPDTHNGMHEWQGSFRIGHFDLLAARHALAVAGNIDCLTISCVDRLFELSERKVCTAYEYQGRRVNGIEQLISGTDQGELTSIMHKCVPIYESHTQSNVTSYLQFLQFELEVPVAITSHGPTEKDKGYFFD